MKLTQHTKSFLIISTVMMALAIAIGAFGAHGLKAIVDESLMKTYQTGVQYHFYNTLGLFVIAFLTYFLPDSKRLVVSGYMLFIGTLIFSCSLYLMVLLKVSWLGVITPFGGSLMIIAWLLCGYSILKDLNIEYN